MGNQSFSFFFEDLAFVLYPTRVLPGGTKAVWLLPAFSHRVSFITLLYITAVSEYKPFTPKF